MRELKEREGRKSIWSSLSSLWRTSGMCFGAFISVLRAKNATALQMIISCTTPLRRWFDCIRSWMGKKKKNYPAEWRQLWISVYAPESHKTNHANWFDSPSVFSTPVLKNHSPGVFFFFRYSPSATHLTWIRGWLTCFCAAHGGVQRRSCNHLNQVCWRWTSKTLQGGRMEKRRPTWLCSISGSPFYTTSVYHLHFVGVV